MIKRYRHFLAIVLLPGLVLIILPLVILESTHSFNPGWYLAHPLNIVMTYFGFIGISLGAGLLSFTIHMFVEKGNGTLAPWDPTQQLVIRGMYRYVRNPMMMGVFLFLIGEVAVVGSKGLLIYTALFIGMNLLYIPLVEERGLKKRFGDDYLRYQKHVPRWIPRISPWEFE